MPGAPEREHHYKKKYNKQARIQIQNFSSPYGTTVLILIITAWDMRTNNITLLQELTFLTSGNVVLKVRQTSLHYWQQVPKILETNKSTFTQYYL